MKTLLLSAFLLIIGGAFISSTKKNYRSELSRDELFTKEMLGSLTSLRQAGDEAQFSAEFRKLANSIALLQQKYPDLNSSATAREAINLAMNRMVGENGAFSHGDTCLRELVHAIFACFRVCTTHQALKACVTAAYTSYQACKEGGER